MEDLFVEVSFSESQQVVELPSKLWIRGLWRLPSALHTHRPARPAPLAPHTISPVAHFSSLSYICLASLPGPTHDVRPLKPHIAQSTAQSTAPGEESSRDARFCQMDHNCRCCVLAEASRSPTRKCFYCAILIKSNGTIYENAHFKASILRKKGKNRILKLFFFDDVEWSKQRLKNLQTLGRSIFFFKLIFLKSFLIFIRGSCFFPYFINLFFSFHYGSAKSKVS